MVFSYNTLGLGPQERQNWESVYREITFSRTCANGPVAQRIEQRFPKPRVGCSSHPRATTISRLMPSRDPYILWHFCPYSRRARDVIPTLIPTHVYLGLRSIASIATLASCCMVGRRWE